MMNAVRHVRSSAYALRAEYPKFPYAYDALDSVECMRMKEWADDASWCIFRGLSKQPTPVDARKISYYLDRCMGVLKILLQMPPTVDAIEPIERVRETIARIHEALDMLRAGEAKGYTLYTFRRESVADTFHLLQ